MKKRSLPELDYSLEIDGKEFDLVIAVSISNDGIGAYEFQGFKGTDQGKDYIEDWSLVSIHLNGDVIHFGSFSSADQKEIEAKVQKYVDSDALSDLIDKNY
jgi:hypothetical protein